MKKTINISNTLEAIKEKFKYTNKELALILGISERTIANLNNGDTPSSRLFNSIIRFIENNNLNIFELFNLDGEEYLFHGSRTFISGTITTKRNEDRLKDFGNGFYLSESFKTAITYVDNYPNPHIYRFKKEKILKQEVYYFKDNQDDIIDWVLFIGLNRNKIADLSDRTFLREYFDDKFKGKKVLVGKIADSFNFDVMDAFFAGSYDIFQVQRALQQVNIGNQIVIINEGLANSLIEYDEFSIDPKLRQFIYNWHVNFSRILKENNQETIQEDDTKQEYKFKAILERMIKEYVRK